VVFPVSVKMLWAFLTLSRVTGFAAGDFLERANHHVAVAQNPADGQRTRMMDAATMDALTALRLQIEWGANEALEAEPVDRLRSPPLHSQSVLSASPTQSASPIRSAPAAPAAGREPPVERATRTAAAAKTLDELRVAIADFDGSALRDTATNLLFVEGDPASGLLFVGEAPNADADRSGTLFAGQVGAYLEQMLRSIGLERGAICLAPLIPWRPPGDRPPSPGEIALYLPFLHRLIVLIGPRRIVTLGPLPARALLGAAPMRRRASPTWQNATIPGHAAPVPTLTMPSPAILLRVPTQRRNAWADLRLLRRTLHIDLTQI
jgi:uracil-DNA glycosylase family 4